MYLILVIIYVFVVLIITTGSVFKYKKKLIIFFRKLVYDKINESTHSKMLYRYYSKKYIPQEYRGIDREAAIENALPYWIEKVLSIVFSYRTWVYMTLIYIILLVGILQCLYIENNHHEPIYIINDFNMIHKFILSSNGTFILQQTIKNQKEDYDRIIIHNDTILWTKILDQQGTYNFQYLNTTGILTFLSEWQYQNKASHYCFCPIFIGIINPKIYFYYNRSIDNWSIIYNFTVNDDLWIKDKTTVLTFKNTELQRLNSLLTGNNHVKHGNNMLIKYFTLKQEEKEYLFNKHETICFNHCIQQIKYI